MKTTKFLSLILAVVMVLAIFSGCASGNLNNRPGQSEVDEPKAPDPEETVEAFLDAAIDFNFDKIREYKEAWVYLLRILWKSFIHQTV